MELARAWKDYPSPSAEGYPVAYRRHIDRYFQEIFAWQIQ